ncbi:chitin deacetylase [Blyttiomyces sp. JEL0837]|nr:chitin deacetylase [Blyttiomyces sp. JEL0837]
MLTSQSNEQIVAEVMWSALAIYSVIGVVPRYFRPPYGDADNRVRAVMDLLGLKMIYWHYDSNDWRVSDTTEHYTMDTVYKNFSDWITANPAKSNTQGPITLEHDLFPPDAEMAKNIIDMLSTAGYKLDTIANLLGDSSPYQTPDAPLSGKAIVLSALGRPVAAAVNNNLNNGIKANNQSITSQTVTNTSAKNGKNSAIITTQGASWVVFVFVASLFQLLNALL